MKLDIPVTQVNKPTPDIQSLSWKIETNINQYIYHIPAITSLTPIKAPGDRDLDTYAELITSSLLSAAENCIPCRRSNRMTKPYWNDDVIQANKFECAYREKWTLEGKPRGKDFPTYVEYKPCKKKKKKKIEHASA